jgi:hypothetical protein
MLKNDYGLKFALVAQAVMGSQMWSDSESIPVDSSMGYLNCGCFCALNKNMNSVRELTKDDVDSDIFGIVLDGSECETLYNRRVVKNQQVAHVMLSSDVFRVTPLIVDKLGNLPDTLKVIIDSVNDDLYPRGAIIFDNGSQTTDYKTFQISGTLTVF